jgi:Tfp pilus assembly protein PilO
MSERRRWITIAAATVLSAAGIGGLIYMQYGKIDEARNEVATLRDTISASRKLIEGTAPLERDVIVLRELTEVMRKILPDTEDVNNLVRTLQKFSEESGVRISGLKKKASDAREKSDFDRVAYTLSLEGDAFQFMDFLDLCESHSRFMRVPNFRISAAQRTQMEKEGVPAHKVQVDVETFVYEPKKDAAPVKIDGYDRKRDLLLGEINRRRQALAFATYSYRGARGRRDPWIDPRVPVMGDGTSALTVQAQMDIVQGLYERTQALLAKNEDLKKAENVIVEMMTRSEMEESLAKLEEDVRRVEAEKSIRYVPSQRRLHSEVMDVIANLRTQIASAEAGRGPSEKTLLEIEKTMLSHEERGEYKLMLEAFAMVDNQLSLADGDPLRKPLVDRLRALAAEAKTVLDFEKIEIKVNGFSLVDDKASVLINGKSLGVGDMLNNELVIRAIRREEIEFIFRGVIFARHF